MCRRPSAGSLDCHQIHLVVEFAWKDILSRTSAGFPSNVFYHEAHEEHEGGQKVTSGFPDPVESGDDALGMPVKIPSSRSSCPSW
jgi:hypothetical protein